ncbi:unnamed protein product [Brassica oleracea]|uniref:Protein DETOXIFICATION n=2 Tax=Brassica TaxID=3705 RepID=A0A0D3B0H3_BRAOL|nr:unnamed protein product [Brassica napus]
MGERNEEEGVGEANIPLLRDQHEGEEDGDIMVETKKLWRIVGPSIFTRITIDLLDPCHHSGLCRPPWRARTRRHLYRQQRHHRLQLRLGMATALETLCGQAFGAKKYEMLGVYLQRSWIILFLCSILLLPMHFFATPILKYFGQPDDIAELSGTIAVWVVPINFAFVFFFPLNRFLQCQLKNMVVAVSSGVALVVHLFVCWLFVYGPNLGVIGTMATVNVSWCLNAFILFTYTTCGGCPLTWIGFSIEAFTGLWEFAKLSASSGIMIWILIMMAGNLEDSKIAVDSVSISMSIYGLELMIPIAFLAVTGCCNWFGLALVAYINLGCYYFIGLPLGFVMGSIFKSGVKGIWAGLIFGGTTIQTLILIFVVMRCDWEKEAQKASVRVKKWSSS